MIVTSSCEPTTVPKNDSSPQINIHASGGCALCLVYNASMKYEMRAKAELHSKHTIHTIHSAAQFIFEGVCGSNDDGIETSLSAPVSTDGHDLVSRITHISRRSARHQADLLRLHQMLVTINLRSPTESRHAMQGQPVERIRCEISDDAEPTIRCADRRPNAP
jgi:hypothetical protein